MMAVFLKAILAICLLVEIVSTTPLGQPEQIDDIKFKKYVSELNASLGPVCKSFEKPPCAEQRVRIITFEHDDEKICQTYRKVFLHVRCALDEVAKSSPTECKETVSNIQLRTELYDNQTNCTLPNGNDMLMKKFCSILQHYVSHLYAICVKN